MFLILFSVGVFLSYEEDSNLQVARLATDPTEFVVKMSNPQQNINSAVFFMADPDGPWSYG